MAKFSHLNDIQFRALQCQEIAAYYSARLQKHRDERWFDDAAACAHWAAHYAERARHLMNVVEA